jgi:hypothetical protein
MTDRSRSFPLWRSRVHRGGEAALSASPPFTFGPCRVSKWSGTVAEGGDRRHRARCRSHMSIRRKTGTEPLLDPDVGVFLGTQICAASTSPSAYRIAARAR